jgi:hypothetical protein
MEIEHGGHAVSPAMQPMAAASAYVERIATPAERLRFPRWYIDKIRRFAGPA